MNSKRRKSREAALKALYQLDLTGIPVQEAVTQLISDEYLLPAFRTFVGEFFKAIADKIRIQEEEVDDCVADLSSRFLAIPRPPTAEIEAIAAEFLLKRFPELTLEELFPEKSKLTEKIASKLSSIEQLEKFAIGLSDKTAESIKEIDSTITRFADNWSMDRMAAIDRAIIRFATCELLNFPSIPVSVTINEAIELAKKYSTERSCEFVNGILDRIQRELKPEKSDPQKAEQVRDTDDPGRSSSTEG